MSKIAAIERTALRIAAKFGWVSGKEIFEEELQNYLEPFVRSIVLGEEYDAPTAAELFETAIVTLLSTGFLEGGDITANEVAETKKYRDAGRTIMVTDGGVDALKTLGTDVAAVVDEKTASKILKLSNKVSGEKASGTGVGKVIAAAKNAQNATRVGKLYNAVRDAGNQANQADIVKSLTRKGFQRDLANDVAEVLVACYNGQELSKEQTQLLISVSGSEAVQDVVDNIISNTLSTMGQRSQNMDSFDADVYLHHMAQEKGVSVEALKQQLQTDNTATEAATEAAVISQGDYVLTQQIVELGYDEVQAQQITDAVAAALGGKPVTAEQAALLSKIGRDDRVVKAIAHLAGQENMVVDTAGQAGYDSIKTQEGYHNIRGSTVVGALGKYDQAVLQETEYPGAYGQTAGLDEVNAVRNRISELSDRGTTKYDDRDVPEGLSPAKYNALLTKKPIQTSKKDWAKVNEARMHQYSRLKESEIPDLDIFSLGEYGQLNKGYLYFVRNYGMHQFVIVGKELIVPEKRYLIREEQSAYEESNGGKKTYTRDDRDGSGRRTDTGDSEHSEDGRKQGENDSGAERNEKPVQNSNTGNSTSDSRTVKTRRLDELSARAKWLNKQLKRDGVSRTKKTEYRKELRAIRKEMDELMPAFRPKTVSTQSNYSQVAAKTAESDFLATGSVLTQQIVELGYDDNQYSKRYSKPFFKGNVFPPFNESQSDSHEIAERWSRNEMAKIDDQALISHHDQWYVIQAMDDMDYGYTILRKLTAAEYKREAKNYGSISGYQSPQDTFDKGTAHLRERTPINGTRSGADSNQSGYRGEDTSVYRVDEQQVRRDEVPAGQISTDQSSDADRSRADGSSVISSGPKQSTGSTFSDKNADKKIIFEGFTYNKRSANKVQRASMEAIDMINRMSSLEIHVYRSYKKDGKRYAAVNGKERIAPNGYFTDGNKIYIDINAGNMGEGLMLYTLSHEIGHYIARYNAQDFKAISNFLFEHYGQSVPINMLLKQQKNKLRKSYKEDGKPIPGEARLEREAQEELVCDMLSRMLADKNAYNKLMEFKRKDLNGFQKLGQAIKKILDKLSKRLGVYDSHNPDFMYAASVESFGEEAFRQLQDLYIKAFVQADVNYHAAEKNTTQEGGVKYSLEYDDAIDQLYVGTLDRTMNTHLKVLDNTPQVYIDKAGAKDQKIIMAWDVAYLAMNRSGDLLGNYHSLGPEVMKAIPKALQDPLYIVKQDNGRIIAVAEIVVKGNRSTLVSIELGAFKSTTQDGQNESENYNLIVTIFDAKANYLQKLMNNGEIVHNKKEEDPVHFILRLKSLKKALPDDDHTKSSNKDIAQGKAKVNNHSTEAATEAEVISQGDYALTQQIVELGYDEVQAQQITDAVAAALGGKPVTAEQAALLSKISRDDRVVKAIAHLAGQENMVVDTAGQAGYDSIKTQEDNINDNRTVREGIATGAENPWFHGRTNSENGAEPYQGKEWRDKPEEIREKARKTVEEHIENAPNADEVYCYLLNLLGIEDSDMTVELYDQAVLRLTERIFNDAVDLNPVIFEEKKIYVRADHPDVTATQLMKH